MRKVCSKKKTGMAPRVKERTRGKKEIHRDNLDTLAFYLQFSIVGTVIQILHLLYYHFLAGTTSWLDGVFLVLAPTVHVVCRWILTRLAQPHLGPNGELLEAGADLTDNYISEYVVDFIILTAFLQGLSFLTNLVWIFWLAVPGFILYKAWILLIWPWFTQATSGDTDNGSGGGGGGKKQKNKVKYMKR